MALVEISQLNVTLTTGQGPLPVLRDVNLSLEAGGTLGLAGESGSGKSMIALALMGLLPEGAHVSGTILLNGRDLLALDDPALCRIRGAEMAMIFQEPMTALNPLHRIGRQIGEPLRLHKGFSHPQAMAEAVQLIERVGLADPVRRAQNYPHELSGGQRQRAMIAMALAARPRLLIADEPTTALDTTTQARILNLVDELVRSGGLALLLVSHDLGVIAQNVAQLAILYAGQIVETGPTAAVLARPAHPYTRGLMAARPRLGATGRLETIAGTAPSPAALPPGCSFAPRCPLVLPACGAAPVAMIEIAPGHQARCLRAGEAP